jgi:hypothetical protein
MNYKHTNLYLPKSPERNSILENFETMSSSEASTSPKKMVYPMYEKDIVLKGTEPDSSPFEIVIPRDIAGYFDLFNELIDLEDTMDDSSMYELDISSFGVFDPCSIMLCLEFAKELRTELGGEDFQIKPPRVFSEYHHTHNYTLKRYGFPEWAVKFFMKIHHPASRDCITMDDDTKVSSSSVITDAGSADAAGTPVHHSLVPPPKYGVFKMEHYHIETFYKMLEIAEYFRFYFLRTCLATCFASYYHHIPQKHIEKHLFNTAGEYTPEQKKIIEKSNEWLFDTKNIFNRNPVPCPGYESIPKYEKIIPKAGVQKDGTILTEQEVYFVEHLHKTHPQFLRLVVKLI